MTQLTETIQDLEELLRGQGVRLTPVAVAPDDLDLQTVDGQFTVSRPRTFDRNMRERDENTVTLYRTDTAEPIPTDVNEALKRLKKRFPERGSFAADHPELAGRFAFTLGVRGEDGKYHPPFTQKVGPLVCMLNKESPDFEYTRTLGIQSVCRRHNIPNIIELERHMKRHEGAWQMVERDKADRTLQEDQSRLTQLIELVMEQRGIDTKRAPEVAQAIAVQTEAIASPVATEGSAAVTSTGAATEGKPRPLTAYRKTCDEPGCDFVTEGLNAMVAGNKLKAHKRKNH